MLAQATVRAIAPTGNDDPYSRTVYHNQRVIGLSFPIGLFYCGIIRYKGFTALVPNTMIAARIAGNTQNLAQELQHKTAQLAALREISRAINAAWDLKDTLELITRKTAQVMDMDSCSIYLLDEAREYLVLKATTGLAFKSVGHARLRPPGGRV